MLQRIRLAVGQRPLVGGTISVLLHVALLLLLFVVPARHKLPQKRGDALIVELPDSTESGARGVPGPSPDVPVPSTPASPPAPKAPPARPTPPARPAAPSPPAQVRPTPKSESRPAQRTVASASQPAPSAEHGDAPTTKSAQQSEVAKSADRPP